MEITSVVSSVLQMAITVLAGGIGVSISTGIVKRLSGMDRADERRKALFRTVAVGLSVVSAGISASIDGTLVPQNVQQGMVDLVTVASTWIIAELSYRTAKKMESGPQR